MTPDLNHSIDLHNRVMATWWKKPEYVAARKAFVARHPVCIRCSRPCTTPGHSHEDYRDYQTYLAAVLSDKCDPLCSTCNNMERSNRRPCPVCVGKYSIDRTVHIHYIPNESLTGHCRFCDLQYTPESAKLKKEFSRKIKNGLHKQKYDQYHPLKKIPVNGTWQEVKRV